MKKIRFDVRSIIVCLSVHFFLLWFSNAEFLTETIHKVNSQNDYWMYQLCLLVFIAIYFLMLIIFSFALKRVLNYQEIDTLF